MRQSEYDAHGAMLDRALSDAARIECERLINTARRFTAARQTAEANEAYGLVDRLLNHGALSAPKVRDPLHLSNLRWVRNTLLHNSR